MWTLIFEAGIGAVGIFVLFSPVWAMLRARD